MSEVKFKVDGYRDERSGKNRLFTIAELIGLPKRYHGRKITVIDTKGQRNYTTSYLTIMRKFR